MAELKASVKAQYEEILKSKGVPTTQESSRLAVNSVTPLDLEFTKVLLIMLLGISLYEIFKGKGLEIKL